MDRKVRRRRRGEDKALAVEQRRVRGAVDDVADQQPRAVRDGLDGGELQLDGRDRLVDDHRLPRRRGAGAEVERRLREFVHGVAVERAKKRRLGVRRRRGRP